MQEGTGGARDEAPLEMLRRLAASEASGEMVCASDAAEVHVYLLSGRLAWATSSTARNAFLRHLVEAHGVAVDVVRDVIAECQRTRRRFGETLVEWGIVSAAQVRGALEAQIGEAMRTLAGLAGARSLFLARRMDYSLAFTFELDGFVAEKASPAVAPPLSDEQADELSRSILAVLPDALWSSVARAGQAPHCLARASSVRPQETVAALAELFAQEDAESIVVRGAYGSVLGQRLAPGSASAWCGLRGDAKLGLACALLAGTAGVIAAPEAVAVAPGWTASPACSADEALAPLANAMRTAEELLGAYVLDASGAAPAFLARSGEDTAAQLERVRRSQRLLDLPLRPALARNTDSMRLVTYDQASARVLVGHRAYLGVQLPAARPRSLWLVVDPAAPQGLGWALLQTLARQVGEGAAS